MYFKKLLSPFTTVVFVTSLPLLILSCDNTINPFEEDDGIYSIYGFLDLNEDQNYIRVHDLNNPIIDDSSQTIDAEVTIKNLETGETETMVDSTVQFEDAFVFNFVTNLEITPATTYQVTATRSDNKETVAAGTMPRIAETDVGPTDELCNEPIRLSFDPVTTHLNLRVSIGVDYSNERHWFNPVMQRGDGEELFVERTPQQMLYRIFEPEVYGEVKCHELDSEVFHVKYTHLGPGWYENDEATDDIYTIQNGVGRFGGLYRDSLSFSVDTTNIALIPG